MSKDTPGNRKSSEGGQGQRGTKPVRQFLIPTGPRTISAAAAAALGRAVARAIPPALQHRQGMLPVPRAGTSTSSRYCSPSQPPHSKGKAAQLLCQEDTTVPQAGKGTVHPHISAHHQFRTWVYQTQGYVSRSGHTWKPTNEQHRARYQTFP